MLLTEILLGAIVVQLVFVWHRLNLISRQRYGPGLFRYYWREFEDQINRVRPGTF
jgi:hypothetical protein